MPLTSQQIVTLANQAAKTSGFTTQAGQKLNLILQDLCMTYDIAQARATTTITFNTGPNGTNSGSGPYLLPSDYLRTQNGKQFYLFNGQPYFMTSLDEWEYDALIQQPGFADFPRNFFVDTSTSLSFPPTVPGDFNQDFNPDFSLGFTPNGNPAQEFVWPPPSIVVPVTIHYYRMMPDIPSPQVASVVPWFPYQQYLLTRLTGEMMALADDTRAADFLTDREEQNPQGAGVLLRKYLTMKDDPEGRAKTVELDRRRFGQLKWNSLPNTKTIGW